MERMLSTRDRATLTAIYLVVILLFGLLLVVMVSAADPAEQEQWVIECVDCPKLFGDMTNRSLRLDAAGHPHIAYGKDHLYYARYDGTNWHYEAADESPGVGEDASLDLDAGGYPHVAYVDERNADLKYAYRDAAGWHVETVDTDSIVGYTSLVLDGSDYPHISYCYGDMDTDYYDLKYAYRDATGWHIEIADSEGNVGLYTSLDLDSSGFPHISYGKGYPGSAFKYAYRDTAGWHAELVQWGGAWGTSLALDTSGIPHVSYNGERELKYGYRDASGWQIETLDTGLRRGPTSLALDGENYPHISYDASGEVDGELRYAYLDASGWHTETVDSSGGEDCSLAVDGDGYPHISYDGLKYAYQDAAGWHVETIDSRSEVGWGTSLAIDSDGYPHISYDAHDEIEGDLRYAYQSAVGWHIETIDREISSGSASLALDGAGYPHLSYHRGESLRYAYLDAVGWHSETVASSGSEYYAYTSLALDGDGNAHISYHPDLKYAYQDAAGWHVETIDGKEWICSASLALDGAGYPHISYADDYGVLGYAYRDTSGWYTETLTNGAACGRSDSFLALDESDHAHIIFFTPYPSDLMYTYQDATGWHTETVDADLGWTHDSSLVLDREGYPHMSYFDGLWSYDPYGPVRDLRYAYLDASGWHSQTVDSEGDVGEYNSLALDEAGLPHISYLDRTCLDLKYAAYGEPDLILDKEVQPGTFVSAGDPITFTLSFGNAGGITATQILISDMVPSEVVGVRFDSSRPVTPAGSLSYTWQVGDLTPGATGVITLTGVVSPALSRGHAFVNTAVITSSMAEGRASNNLDSVRVTVSFPVYLPIVMKDG